MQEREDLLRRDRVALHLCNMLFQQQGLFVGSGKHYDFVVGATGRAMASTGALQARSVL